MENTKDKIDLNIIYKKATSTFGDLRFFGVFDIEDKIIEIFFPQIKDIAINCGITDSKFFDEEQKQQINLFDFRLLWEKIFSNPLYLKIFFTKNYKVSPIYQKSYQKLKEKILSYTVGNLPDKSNELAEALAEIFEHYLQFCGGNQDQLFINMTKTEEKALTYLLNTIGDQGIISVSEAIRESGISRPVFTSLFDKLNRYKGAEIRNMGVKGTYIDFYDHVMSKFEQVD